MALSLLPRWWELVRTEPEYQRRMRCHLYLVPDRDLLRSGEAAPT